MRLRYLVGIWVIGALIAGFAAGEIVERDHWLGALSKVRNERYRMSTTPASQEQVKSVMSRC